MVSVCFLVYCKIYQYTQNLNDHFCPYMICQGAGNHFSIVYYLQKDKMCYLC